jgi:hypothetical protein
MSTSDRDRDLWNPHEVFCRKGMAMIGNGTVWMAEDKDGQVKILVVNQ